MSVFGSPADRPLLENHPFSRSLMAEFPLPEGVEDLTGRQFGRLSVTGWHFKKNGVRHWICDCSCGRTKAVGHQAMRAGRTVSCGCKHGLPHGMSESPEYSAWISLKKRCRPDFIHADRYADRGITVCPEWEHDFLAFYNHIGPMPEPGLEVERIDNDKGYEVGNVKWATRTEQMRNTSKNVNIEFRGETRCMQDWANVLGIENSLLWKRYRRDKLTMDQIVEMYGIQYPPQP